VAHHLLAAGGSRGEWSRGKGEDAQIIFPIASCLGEEEGAELFHRTTSWVDDWMATSRGCTMTMERES
jgi:hypothetical protein